VGYYRDEDEEFRELIEEARDAVRKLLDDSEHDSWVALRRGYRELRWALDLRDSAPDETAPAAVDAFKVAEKAANERRRAWQQMSRDQRENLLLHVLSDRQLLIRELTSRLNVELGPADRKIDRTLYDSDVRSLVMRLFREGQLERESETFNKTHMRYRYMRRRELDGPIAGLERAYRAESEAA
jgi:hypothetical protein